MRLNTVILLFASVLLSVGQGYKCIPESATVRSQRDIFRKLISAGVLARVVFTVAVPPAQSAVENKLKKLPECNDAVTLLRKAGGKDVVVIGTAHISEESAELVRRIVQSTQPDVVMIELDAKRIGKLNSSELDKAGFLLPSSSSSSSSVGSPSSPPLSTLENNVNDAPSKGPSFFSSLTSGFLNTLQGWRDAAGGAVMGKVLSGFYKSVENLGFEAGNEFKVAVEEGRAINAKILLGDRDVDITLQRLALALESTKPEALVRLSSRIEEQYTQDVGAIEDSMFENKAQLASYVERMKQRKTLNFVMQALQEETPALYNALIGERDAFMAQAIANTDAKLLVAVVGIAHMNGIENGLMKEGYTILKNNCAPR